MVYCTIIVSKGGKLGEVMHIQKIIRSDIRRIDGVIV